MNGNGHVSVTVQTDPVSAPLPAGISHLLAADDALSEARWGAHIALCGQEVHSPNVEHDDVLGCAGMRYCPGCVREAIRWSAEAGQPDCACGDPR